MYVIMTELHVTPFSVKMFAPPTYLRMSREQLKIKAK